MSVNVLRDYVLVSKDESVKQTAGGLFIPDSASDEKVATGTVMSVGSGRVSANGVVVPLEVKVGQKVAFHRSMATEVKENGTTVLVLREDNILCVLS